ncbi:MAG: PDGLE domain-containing protein [Thermacetogeniaceae bacterium]
MKAKKNLLWGMAIALAVAAFLSPFASSSPDGLERVAKDLGFLHLAEGKELLHTVMPDYKFPGISHEGMATAVAGIIGTLLAFAAVYAAGKILALRSSLKSGDDKEGIPGQRDEPV